MTEVDYRAVTTHPIAHRTSGKSDKHHKPHADTAEYEKLYKESIAHPAQFWDRVRAAPLWPCSGCAGRRSSSLGGGWSCKWVDVPPALLPGCCALQVQE